MKDFLRGCLVGAVIVASVGLVIGAIFLLKTLPPWLNFTVMGITFILGMGEIFRRTGGP